MPFKGHPNETTRLKDYAMRLSGKRRFLSSSSSFQEDDQTG
jgi:hypothetical protein